MNNTNKKISTSQLFCLLILTRLAGEVVFPRTVSSNAAASVCAIVLAETIQLILAMPAIIYSFRGENFYGAIYAKNRFFGWAVAVSAALLMLSSAMMTIVYTSEFAVKNLLVGGSMWVLFVISAALAVYSAIMGAEAQARAGALFLVGAVMATAVVILADIPYMKLPSEEIVFSVRLDDFLSEIIRAISRGGDYLIFTAFIPYIARKNTRSVGRCGLVFGLCAILAATSLAVVCSLVLREMYGAVEYPFIAAASISDIAFFKRLDGAVAAIWSLGAVFRGGVLLLCAKQAIQSVYKASRKKRSTE